MLKDFLLIFHYRGLINALVARDLKARYKKSVLGYAWTWLDPLMTMFVFIFVFGLLLKMGTENYPIFLLSGLLPWTFFSNSLSAANHSIINNEGITKRIYFPREILPISVVLSNAVNMVLGLIVILPVILAFGIPLTDNLILIPIPFCFLIFLTLGISFFLSSLNVFFRDMSYIVPFILHLWFFMTPIFFNIESNVPANYLSLYLIINPLAVILSLFRTCLMGHPLPAMAYILSCFSACTLVFLIGYGFFKKTENLMMKRI